MFFFRFGFFLMSGSLAQLVYLEKKGKILQEQLFTNYSQLVVASNA